MTNAEMFQDVFGRFPYLPCEDGYYIDAKLQDRQWWDMLFRDVRPVKWIPVTERLPGIGERVITYRKGYGVKENFRSGDGTWWSGFKITHWMPLPEPPKEE